MMNYLPILQLPETSMSPEIHGWIAEHPLLAGILGFVLLVVVVWMAIKYGRLRSW